MQPTTSKQVRAYVRCAAIFIGLVFFLASIANAQSGRRAPARSTTVPTVSGPRAAEKKPVTPPTDDRTSLVLTIEERNVFSGLPYYLAGTIRDTCGESLRKAPQLKVEIASRSMDRGEAAKRAKAEKETYVVWLQIDTDQLNRSATEDVAPDSLYVRYTIFSPVTAKIKASGRTYQQINRTGKGGILSRLPGSRSGAIYSEYALKQAAREAAERILDAFKLNIPDGRIPG